MELTYIERDTELGTNGEGLRKKPAVTAVTAVTALIAVIAVTVASQQNQTSALADGSVRI
jgi:hypothetical protein